MSCAIRASATCCINRNGLLLGVLWFTDVSYASQALDNARKDMDKIRKRRAPFEKKVEQDPNYLTTLESEIQGVQADISQLE